MGEDESLRFIPVMYAYLPGKKRCPALHCTALYCIVLYCTVLDCTILHCKTWNCREHYGAVYDVILKYVEEDDKSLAARFMMSDFEINLRCLYSV